jgi:serpin B
MSQHKFWLVGAIVVSGVLLMGLAVGLRSVGEQAVSLPDPTPLISPAPTAKAINPKAMNPKLVEANTRFGFKLFSQLLKQEKGKNVFVSPASVAIALGMTYNGASPETQQALAKVMELRGMSLAELNQANATLRSQLENPDPQVQLAIANSLWGNQNVPFQPDFLQRNQQFYGAKVTNLNFSSPKAADTINNWVKENTRNKIDKIIDGIEPDEVLFLLNAIYFKGDWAQKFDEKLTTDQRFYLTDGTQKVHPRMVQEGNYRYHETDRFQAVSLPYGKNRRMSLYVFLPKSTSNLAEFSQQLNAENWQQWMNQFRTRPGAIQLPRFKLEYGTELLPALQAIGLSKISMAITNQAPNEISQVKHKTFVEVNEKGTEAAAVTSVGIRTTSAQLPTEPFSMVVDRPFFCAIRDNQTGTVLFMGAITEPK